MGGLPCLLTQYITSCDVVDDVIPVQLRHLFVYLYARRVVTTLLVRECCSSIIKCCCCIILLERLILQLICVLVSCELSGMDTCPPGRRPRGDGEGPTRLGLGPAAECWSVPVSRQRRGAGTARRRRCSTPFPVFSCLGALD